MKMLKINWHWAVISLLIGFAGGVAFGQWYGRESSHCRWKKGGMRQHMLERFDRELHLTADQKKQVETIFDAHHPQMEALQEEIRPKFEALRNTAQAEIRKLLNPEQQKKFDDLNVKMEERWKDRRNFFAA